MIATEKSVPVVQSRARLWLCEHMWRPLGLCIIDNHYLYLPKLYLSNCFVFHWTSTMSEIYLRNRMIVSIIRISPLGGNMPCFRLVPYLFSDIMIIP